MIYCYPRLDATSLTTRWCSRIRLRSTWLPAAPHMRSTTTLLLPLPRSPVTLTLARLNSTAMVCMQLLPLALSWHLWSFTLVHFFCFSWLSHPLPAIATNWTRGADSRHTTAPISHTRAFIPWTEWTDLTLCEAVQLSQDRATCSKVAFCPKGSVREYVFYVFFSDLKNMTFYVFWNDVSKKT